MTKYCSDSTAVHDRVQYCAVVAVRSVVVITHVHDMVKLDAVVSCVVNSSVVFSCRNRCYLGLAVHDSTNVVT